MIVEDEITSLKEGEGLMVKAGLKHMHTADEKLWMMVISKWPHEHVYYDLRETNLETVLEGGKCD